MEEKFGLRTKMYIMEEVKEKLKEHPNFIITNYKGLSSQEVETLRKKLNTVSSAYFVVKNSIAKRALGQLELNELAEFIQGETGIGLVGDVIETSKTLVDFSKDHSALKVNCAFIDGKVEGVDRIKQLAALPPKNVLLAMIATYMKSPITGFVGVLQGLLRNLVYAINEIKNKKEGGEKK